MDPRVRRRRATAATVAILMLATACTGDGDPAPTPSPTPTVTIEVERTLALSTDDVRPQGAMAIQDSTGTVWLWATCEPSCTTSARDALWGVARNATVAAPRIALGSLGCVPPDSQPGIAIAGTTAFVTPCDRAGYLVVDLEGRTPPRSVAMNDLAISIDVEAQASRLYLSTEPGLTAIAIGTGMTAGTVNAGNPGDVALLPAIQRAAVANLDLRTVTLVNTASMTVASTVTVPHDANCLSVDRTRNRIYVSDGVSETVTVVDANAATVMATVDIGVPACDFGVDESAGRVFALNTRAPTITALDAETLAQQAEIVIGRDPVRILVDPTTSQALVTHQDGALSVISTTVT